jgi:hypothetical protein
MPCKLTKRTTTRESVVRSSKMLAHHVVPESFFGARLRNYNEAIENVPPDG